MVSLSGPRNTVAKETLKYTGRFTGRYCEWVRCFTNTKKGGGGRSISLVPHSVDTRGLGLQVFEQMSCLI